MTTIVTETVRLRDTIIRDPDTFVIAAVVDTEGKVILFSNGTGSKDTAAAVLKGIIEDLTRSPSIELKALPVDQAQAS